MYSRIWVIPMVLLMLSLGSSVRAQGSGSALELGKTALESGRYEEAAGFFQQATRRRRTRAEAHYRLARLYSNTPLRNLQKAHAEIKRAIEYNDEDLRFLSLRLELYLADSTSIGSRMERLDTRKRLAQKMLELDPANELALEEMGRVYLDDLHWNVIATARFKTKFFETRWARSFEKAESSFLEVLRLNPKRRSTYRYLITLYVYHEEFEAALDLLDTMKQHFPEEAETWLYAGLIYHNLSEATLAAECFENALVLMDLEMYTLFQDVSHLIHDDEFSLYQSDSSRYVDRFWATRDPRMLTPENERRNEHYARLIYTDLLYDEPKQGRRGWETERGETFLRYGKPANPVVTNSHYSSLSTWHYEEFDLKFEGFNGYYTFYSPPATAFVNASNVNEAWNADYVIRAREIKRKWPESYAHEEPGRRITLPYLVSAFKGADGQTDLYISYGIPIVGFQEGGPGVEVNVETGVFLIGNDGIEVSERRIIHGFSPDQVVAAGEMNAWTDSYHLHTKPGEMDLSVEFETESGETVGYQRDVISIPAFDSTDLALSDIMPAGLIEEVESETRVAGGTIVRDGLSITPMAAGVYRTEQPIYLYFEAYHLTQDPLSETHYEVEAALIRRDERAGLQRLIGDLFRSRSEGVSVRFQAHGKTPDDAIYLIMDAHAERAGTFDLVVTLTDSMSGQVTESKRTLILE